MKISSLFKIHAGSMRALAAFAVIFSHVFAYASTYYIGSQAQNLALYFDVVLHYAVPMFILFSSYFLFLKYSNGLNLKGYFLKRVNKILIPYMLFSILYSYFYGMISNKPTSFQLILNNLISGRSAPHMYYLLTILELYILFPLFISALKKIRINIKVALFVTFILQAMIWIFTAQISKAFPFSPFATLLGDSIFRFIFYVFLGYFLFVNREVKISLSLENIFTKLLLVFSVSTIIFSTWILDLKHIDFLIPHTSLSIIEIFLSPVIYSIIIMLLFIALDKIMPLMPRLFKMLSGLGNISYEIYLVHIIPIALIDIYLSNIKVSPDRYIFYVIMGPLAALISVMFAYVLRGGLLLLKTSYLSLKSRLLTP